MRFSFLIHNRVAGMNNSRRMTLAEFSEMHLKSTEEKCGVDRAFEQNVSGAFTPKDECCEDGFAGRVVSGMSRLREG